MAVEIEVTVDPRGVITIEVNGVRGPSCSTTTDAIVRALDGVVVDDVKKPEFYQTTRETVKASGKEVW